MQNNAETGSSKSGQHALNWYGPRNEKQDNHTNLNWDHSQIFVLGKWLDINSIKCENKGKAMDLGRKTEFKFWTY
jgi:hypothetical protein